MEKKLRFGLVFWLVDNPEKKNWADYEQLLRAVFSCFQGQKIFRKKIVASALKGCIIPLL
jgi:hypothetical protein